MRCPSSLSNNLHISLNNNIQQQQQQNQLHQNQLLQHQHNQQQLLMQSQLQNQNISSSHHMLNAYNNLQQQRQNQLLQQHYILQNHYQQQLNSQAHGNNTMNMYSEQAERNNINNKNNNTDFNNLLLRQMQQQQKQQSFSVAQQNSQNLNITPDNSVNFTLNNEQFQNLNNIDLNYQPNIKQLINQSQLSRQLNYQNQQQQQQQQRQNLYAANNINQMLSNNSLDFKQANPSSVFASPALSAYTNNHGLIRQMNNTFQQSQQQNIQQLILDHKLRQQHLQNLLQQRQQHISLNNTLKQTELNYYMNSNNINNSFPQQTSNNFLTQQSSKIMNLKRSSSFDDNLNQAKKSKTEQQTIFSNNLNLYCNATTNQSQTEIPTTKNLPNDQIGVDINKTISSISSDNSLQKNRSVADFNTLAAATTKLAVDSKSQISIQALKEQRSKISFKFFKNNKILKDLQKSSTNTLISSKTTKIRFEKWKNESLTRCKYEKTTLFVFYTFEYFLEGFKTQNSLFELRSIRLSSSLYNNNILILKLTLVLIDARQHFLTPTSNSKALSKNSKTVSVQCRCYRSSTSNKIHQDKFFSEHKNFDTHFCTFHILRAQKSIEHGLFSKNLNDLIKSGKFDCVCVSSTALLPYNTKQNFQHAHILKMNKQIESSIKNLFDCLENSITKKIYMFNGYSSVSTHFPMHKTNLTFSYSHFSQQYIFKPDVIESYNALKFSKTFPTLLEKNVLKIVQSYFLNAFGFSLRDGNEIKSQQKVPVKFEQYGEKNSKLKNVFRYFDSSNPKTPHSHKLSFRLYLYQSGFSINSLEHRFYEYPPNNFLNVDQRSEFLNSIDHCEIPSCVEFLDSVKSLNNSECSILDDPDIWYNSSLYIEIVDFRFAKRCNLNDREPYTRRLQLFSTPSFIQNDLLLYCKKSGILKSGEEADILRRFQGELSLVKQHSVLEEEALNLNPSLSVLRLYNLVYFNRGKQNLIPLNRSFINNDKFMLQSNQSLLTKKIGLETSFGAFPRVTSSITNYLFEKLFSDHSLMNYHSLKSKFQSLETCSNNTEANAFSSLLDLQKALLFNCTFLKQVEFLVEQNFFLRLCILDNNSKSKCDDNETLSISSFAHHLLQQLCELQIVEANTKLDSCQQQSQFIEQLSTYKYCGSFDDLIPLDSNSNVDLQLQRSPLASKTFSSFRAQLQYLKNCDGVETAVSESEQFLIGSNHHTQIYLTQYLESFKRQKAELHFAGCRVRSSILPNLKLQLLKKFRLLFSNKSMVLSSPLQLIHSISSITRNSTNNLSLVEIKQDAVQDSNDVGNNHR